MSLIKEGEIEWLSPRKVEIEGESEETTLIVAHGGVQWGRRVTGDDWRVQEGELLPAIQDDKHSSVITKLLNPNTKNTWRRMERCVPLSSFLLFQYIKNTNPSNQIQWEWLYLIDPWHNVVGMGLGAVFVYQFLKSKNVIQISTLNFWTICFFHGLIILIFGASGLPFLFWIFHN